MIDFGLIKESTAVCHPLGDGTTSQTASLTLQVVSHAHCTGGVTT